MGKRWLSWLLWPLLGVPVAVAGQAASQDEGEAAYSRSGSRSEAFLVEDIARGVDTSGPRELVGAGDLLFFSAADVRTGRELWKADADGRRARRVKDLFPGSRGSSPEGLVEMGGVVFFSALREVDAPRLLWRSDGSERGTVPVTERITSVQVLASLGERLLFLGSGPEGSGMYASDGTEAGTRYLGAVGAQRSDLAVVDGVLYFTFMTADEGPGTELWRSDGTPEGTFMVRDINPGSAEADVREFTPVGDTLYFFATDGRPSGLGLFRSDGTEAGTVRIAELSGFPSQLTAVGDTLFFASTDAEGVMSLWRSDGTRAGTAPLVRFPSLRGGLEPRELTAVGDMLFFVSDDGEHGLELWKSDGTARGTKLVEDIRPGRLGSGPAFLTALGGKLYFAAQDGRAGAELWVSDGSRGGTYRVDDIARGAFSSVPRQFTRVEDTLFFTAYHPDTGGELWALRLRSSSRAGEAREAGTGSLEELRGALDTAPPTRALAAGALLALLTPWGPRRRRAWRLLPLALVLALVAGCTSATEEPREQEPSASEEARDEEPVVQWRERSSSCGERCQGAYLVQDLYPGPQWPFFFPDFATLGGRLYLRADDSVQGHELWKTDGTAEGTRLVKDLFPGPEWGFPILLTEARDRLYFFAEDGEHGRELWVSDGTEKGTRFVKDLTSGPEDTLATEMVAVGRTVYFLTWDALWKSDGTERGTVLVRGGLGFSVNTLTAVGDRVFFVSATTDTGRELWTSDGTAEGTRLVEDINPGPAWGDPLYLTAAHGKLYFFPRNESVGRELWVSDGTARGTHPVRDIVPGPGDGIATLPLPTLLGRWLFFVGSTPDTGPELWKTDGTSRGTVRVKDIAPGPGGAFPQELRGSDGVLYFLADSDRDGFVGIWKSDGTARGTVRVFERPEFFASVELMLSVDGKLLFRADDRVHGAEPWVSDGTEKGTRMLRDIALGEESSFPMAFTRAGARVFFIANDGFTGMEPWAVPVSSLGRECRDSTRSAEVEAQTDSRQRCSR